jgi:hypothetical protein
MGIDLVETALASIKQAYQKYKEVNPGYAPAQVFLNIMDESHSAQNVTLGGMIGMVRREGTYEQKQTLEFRAAESAVEQFLKRRAREIQQVAAGAGMESVVAGELRTVNPDKPDSKREAGV